MDYFKKLDQNPYADLYWNLPDQKRGRANVVGGNSQHFQTVIRTAEFLARHYPLQTVQAVLPATLQKNLPPLPDFTFLPATDSGSFSGAKLPETLDRADYNLLIGDFSKNSITGEAVVGAVSQTTVPTLITRDAIDLLADHSPDAALQNPQVSLLATAAQLKKLLAAVYYPKMLLLSQSLLQVAEILHKFTLSYPVGLITLYNGQILVARDGAVVAISLEKSGFSPISLWGGEFASRLLALNLFNPNNFLSASVAAIFPSK